MSAVLVVVMPRDPKVIADGEAEGIAVPLGCLLDIRDEKGGRQPFERGGLRVRQDEIPVIAAELIDERLDD